MFDLLCLDVPARLTREALSISFRVGGARMYIYAHALATGTHAAIVQEQDL